MLPPEELSKVRKKTDRPMDRPLPFQVPAVATKISRFRLSAFRLGAALQGIPYVPGTLEWYSVVPGTHAPHGLESEGCGAGHNGHLCIITRGDVDVDVDVEM